MKSEQHIQLDVAIEGNDNISFITDLGWMDAFSYSIDATSMGEARTTAISILNDLNIAPGGNCSSNEDNLLPAYDIVKEITDALELVQEPVANSSIHLEINDILSISIKFKRSYEVLFG